MGLTLDFEAEGLEEAQAFVEQFMSLGSQIAGVELNDIERTPYSFAPNAKQPSNSYLLQEAFPDQERDFVTLDEDQSAKIGAAFERAAQVEIDKFESKAGALDKQSIQRRIDQAASKAFIAAMREYMAAVTENIKAGRIVNKTLSEQWAEIKEQHFGRTYPIGIASEQLVENLDSSGAAVRNIKLLKKSSILGG